MARPSARRRSAVSDASSSMLGASGSKQGADSPLHPPMVGALPVDPPAPPADAKLLVVAARPGLQTVQDGRLLDRLECPVAAQAAAERPCFACQIEAGHHLGQLALRIVADQVAVRD